MKDKRLFLRLIDKIKKTKRLTKGYDVTELLAAALNSRLAPGVRTADFKPTLVF
jgi:hypothetical protein